MFQADWGVSEALLQGAEGLFATEDLDSSNTILLPLEGRIVNRSSKYAEFKEFRRFCRSEHTGESTGLSGSGSRMENPVRKVTATKSDSAKGRLGN